MFKNTSGIGISKGAPLQLRRTWNLEGGSYTGDFKRRMKEGSSNRASISEGLDEGELERQLLYWGPQKMSSKALEMGVCFHSSPAFGKHEGALFLRASE
jgi:hypothetical protein